MSKMTLSEMSSASHEFFAHECPSPTVQNVLTGVILALNPGI